MSRCASRLPMCSAVSIRSIDQRGRTDASRRAARLWWQRQNVAYRIGTAARCSLFSSAVVPTIYAVQLDCGGDVLLRTPPTAKVVAALAAMRAPCCIAPRGSRVHHHRTQGL